MSDPWLDARIAEELRLWGRNAYVWLGAVLCGLMAAFVAWFGARTGWAPGLLDGAGAGLGLALAGLGVLLERRWLATSLALKGAGFALLALAAVMAVSLHAVLPVILGGVFLALTGWVATELLGRGSGLLAIVIGLLGGTVTRAALSWGSPQWGDFGSFLLVLAAMAVLTLCWRQAWLPPLFLAGLGLLLGNGISQTWGATPAGWLCCAVLCAGLIALGRLEPFVQGLAWIGASMGVALIAAAPLSLGLRSIPAERLGLGLLLAGAIASAGWGATRPARWTALSAMTSLVLFLDLVLTGRDTTPEWSVLALGASLLYLGGTWLVSRRATADPGDRRTALLPLAVATAAFSVLAMALAIGPVWPGIAAALLVPLLIVLRILSQDRALGMPAVLLGLFSLGWILSHTEELRFPGGPEDLPWVLYGFGVPFVALAAAAWLARRSPVTLRMARPLTGLAVISACLLASSAERQGVPQARTATVVLATLAPLIAFLAFHRLGQMNARARRQAAVVLLVAFVALGARAVAEVREVVPGPEQVHELPPLPAAAAAPGAPLSFLGFASSWPVRAPGARPGDVVRLTVPDEVEAQRRDRYEQLKVASGNREVQSQLSYTQTRFAQILELHGARPRPSGQAGVSRIDLPLPANEPWTTIHLRTLPAAFRRKVELRAGNSVLANADWTCRPETLLPCALDLEYQSAAFRAFPLSLRFLDGDNPPLKEVDIAIWKRPDQLVFVWPQGGPVRMVMGAQSTDYRPLGQALAIEIESRPWRTARVEVSRDDRREVATMAFLLAAGGLLGLRAWRRRLFRGSIGSTAALVLAGLSALCLPAAGQEGVFYTRPVEVTTAGWVRVPLDLATLGHLGESFEGVRVLAPGGKEISRRLEPDGGGYVPSFGPVKLSTSQNDGKTLVVLGPASGAELPHGRILLDSAWRNFAPVPGAPIEESLDGSSWQPLGEQDLFETWQDSGHHGDALLEYPAGHRRYLRVTLPADHDVQFAEVVAAPSALMSVPIERPDCASARLVTACRLLLPAGGQRPVRLSIGLAESGPVGLRLYAAREGSWKLFTQGVSLRASARHEIPIALKALAGRVLRLEMQGRDHAPRLVAATLELAQPAVVFRAPTPGRYLLRYGDGLSGPYEQSGADREAEVPPGPESATPLPVLPEGAGRPAVPLSERRAAAWRVIAPGAKPGDVVRLEIPAEVYRRSLNFGRDLRLSVADLQLPHLGHVADEPALAVELPGLRNPFDVPQRRESLPLTTYQVTSSSSGGIRATAGERSLGSVSWDCVPLPLLPCRQTADLNDWNRRHWPPPRFSVTGEPVPYDDLTLWRRRDVLVFVWPREGPVRLLAGRGADAPSYDLELFASQVLARPWKPARLGPEEPEVPLSALAVVAAGCAVLVLLWQALAGRPVVQGDPKRG